jgi:hypothetical protein
VHPDFLSNASRRSFLRRMRDLILVSLLGCRGESATTGSLAPSPTPAFGTPNPADANPATTSRAIDLGLLGDLAGVVLPSSLTADDRRRVVESYVSWLGAYQPGADLLALEDSAFLSELPFERAMRAVTIDPIVQCAGQLEALARLSVATFARSFAELAPGEKAEVVRRVLGEVISGLRLTTRNPLGDPAIWLAGPAAFIGLPSDHVAITLMAFYFASPDAIERCYGARLRPRTCRGFADVGRDPGKSGT